VLLAAAGNGLNSFSGDLGPAASAQIDKPAQLAFDAAGNLYFADSKNNRIRKITPAGTITTVAGNALPGFFGDAGPATLAELNNPTGVAVDFAGNLYIADTGNNRIRQVLPNGIIGTFAGNGNSAFFGDGGTALNAALQGPRAVIVDLDGNVYVADTLNHHVRVIRGDGTIDSVAGNNGSLKMPSAIALDAAGNLFIADEGNHRVRKLSGATGELTTVDGTDGSEPRGLTADSSGNVYYSDATRNVVRRIAPDGTVTTVAGTGSCCYAGDGGSATSALLNQPWGLAADSAGRIWIGDAGNNAIRLLSPGSQNSFIRLVANGASNLTGSIAPGEILVIYGSGIGPTPLTTFQLNAAGLVPTTIGGYKVLVNDMPAPLLFASAGQVSAVVPYGVTGSRAQIVVQNPDGQRTPPVTLPLGPVAPGVYTADPSGSGQARAFNQDGSANGAARPASAGSLLTLFLTGEGQTVPNGIDGKPAGSPAPIPERMVEVTIGGKPATVQYAGGVPGAVAGVMQLNLQVPANLTGSAVPVVVTIDGVASQPGVTVAVGN